MCGILGVAGQQFSDNIFRQALSELRHRGPDDFGVYREAGVTLGHRRLAILDISERGHQPMRESSSGAVISYNGEIYNFLEIRKELQSFGWSFFSESDTEVVLKAFLTWGARALDKFNGMWALVVWIPRENKIFFARDRFGIKPFYYIKDVNSFAFASEPKALLRLLPKYRKVNLDTLRKFLSEGQLYTGNYTFYEGINALQPACCGEFHLGRADLKIWRYWRYPDQVCETRSSGRDEAVDEFCEIFRSAVSMRLRSDVPLGVTLSGGLDSTAVLAATQANKNINISCYTSVYSDRERGEAGWTTLAAGAYGLVPVEVKAECDHWIRTLRKIAWHMDGPGYSPAVYPLWNLMAEARRRNSIVLLDGQGADEALGGYVSHSVANLIRLIVASRGTPFRNVHELREALLAAIGAFGSKRLILWFLRETFPFIVSYHRKRRGALSVLRPEIARLPPAPDYPPTGKPRNMDRVTDRLWSDHSQSILPGLLHYGDVISMAHGIENRNPFMDYRLIEWAFSHSANDKMAFGKSKWPIRHFLLIEGQTKIAGRKDKKGYPTPVEKWLRKESGKIAKDILLDSRAKIREYTEANRIERLITKHLAGQFNVGNHLYRLISTELWLQACL